MGIIQSSLIKESQERYLTYALSVVSGRALPDVRDGLKPVQRRILYAMFNNLKLRPNGAYRKSAAVVGEVLARFHPHGDIACYDAMVRMAQSFSLRYTLVDGQGNFGSLDGDSPAAYRYTECKLTELAVEVIGELEEDTVGFRDNFDGTQQEPEVLPTKVPGLLLNGASGIAVGMATNIPPHNLKDTVKALIELLNDPKISEPKLISAIKGPDFPTGCLVLNNKRELNEIYSTGRGSIKMRADWTLEDLGRGKKAIVVSSIPYAVNKAQVVEKIANLIIAKKIPQLLDVRDESTVDVRVVLELSPNADPELAMAFLFRNTNLESNFVVNMTALVPVDDGHLVPQQLSLKSCLQHFLDFRQEVTRRRLEFEKRKLEERVHILEGLMKIFDALEEAIRIVRKSSGRSDAANSLAKRFKLTEIQAFAVVDMRIYQLSRTNIEELKAELKSKLARIKEIIKILKSAKAIADLVRKDLEEVSSKYGDKRKSKLVSGYVDIEVKEEDFIVQEDVYAIVTKDGWLKRIRQNNELSSTRLREGDSIVDAHALNTTDSVILFTNFGSIYQLRVADFPSSSGYGTPVQKILKFKDGEQIVTSFGVLSEQSKNADSELAPGPRKLLKDGDEFILVSEKGMGFTAKVVGIDTLKKAGRRVMKLKSGDAMAFVVAPASKLAFFSKKGYGLVMKQKEILPREGASIGVSLFKVKSDDKLVGVVGFDKQAKFKLDLASGRSKEVGSKEMLEGHRALIGRKVLNSGEIQGVVLVNG